MAVAHGGYDGEIGGYNSRLIPSIKPELFNDSANSSSYTNDDVSTERKESALTEEEEEEEGATASHAIHIKEEVLEEDGANASSSLKFPKPMEGLHDVGPPPFLKKTFEMVEDPETDPIVSWSGSRDSFVVWDSHEFSKILLPKYFKHNNFSSFIRQLNTYVSQKNSHNPINSISLYLHIYNLIARTVILYNLNQSWYHGFVQSTSYQTCTKLIF